MRATSIARKLAGVIPVALLSTAALGQAAGGTTVPNNSLPPIPGSTTPGFNTPSPSLSTPSPNFSFPAPSLSTPSPDFSFPSPSFSTPSPDFGTGTPGPVIQLQPPSGATPGSQTFPGVRTCPRGMTFC